MARKKGRSIDGVLLLNKPLGMSSNQALQRAKRLFNANKAGHTGSLDPLATGVLPLCFGEATKFSQFLLDADKAYRSTFVLGVNTTTCDAEGEVLEVRDASSIDEQQVIAALKQFTGDIQQVPPMYSALKHQGQPLYKLARDGVEIEREARHVTVYQIQCLAFRAGVAAEVDLEVSCSKGTYIRSLADDLGRILGCGGHVKHLHRTQAGAFVEAQTVTFERLEQLRGDLENPNFAALDHQLLSADAPVASLPAIHLPSHSAHYFRQGNPVMDQQVFALAAQGGMVRVFCSETEQKPAQFLGIGELTDDGRVAPKRIIANASQDD